MMQRHINVSERHERRISRDCTAAQVQLEFSVLKGVRRDLTNHKGSQDRRSIIAW